MSQTVQHPFGLASRGSSTWSYTRGSAYPHSAPMMSPGRETIMVVTCTWIAHPHTPPSDLILVYQVCWSDSHVVLWYSCSLNVVGSRVLPLGARWSYTNVQSQAKKCCRRRCHAQLTPLYSLVHRILQMPVTAATFVARERLVVCGLALRRATNYISSGPPPSFPKRQIPKLVSW